MSEALERFAFYGMLALFSLYLYHVLSAADGGAHIWGMRPLVAFLAHGTTHHFQAVSTIFGLTLATALSFTVAGGVIGDRVLGRMAAMKAGGVMSVIGYLLMAAETPFLIGLLLVTVGSGAFKSNIVSEIAARYPPNAPERETGFRLLLIAINIGMLAAPFICGALVQAAGWRWGFLAAAAGMGLSLAIVLAMQGRPSANVAQADAPAGASRPGFLQLAALAIVLGLLAVATTGSQQILNAYLSWADRSVDLSLGGFTAPTVWLLTLDSTMQLLMLLLLTPFWMLWRRAAPEPDALTKIGLGCLIVAAAYGLLAAFGLQQQSGDLLLIVGFHLVNSMGYGMILPAALILLTGQTAWKAPSTIIGLYYLQFAASALAAGYLGRFLDLLHPAAFWLLHAALVLGAGIAVLLLRSWLNRTLNESPGAGAAVPAPPSSAPA